MENIKFIFALTGICFLTFFYSCDNSSDDDYPVTISFSNESALDSVYDGDTYTLKGKVIAGGPIERIQFYRNFPFTYQQDSVEISRQDSVEMAATEITDIPGDTCTFSVDVPNITYETRIKVTVTQSNGHQAFATYTIKSGRISNIVTLSNNWSGGWDSPYYGNFFSIIDGVTYGFSIEWKHPELIQNCDFYFGDFAVGAIDLDASKHSSGVAAFDDMGTRFAKTGFTAEEFDAMRDDDDFGSMSDPTLQSVDFEEEDVILFKTRTGKKGLLKIISLNSEEDYNFDVKVQK